MRATIKYDLWAHHAEGEKWRLVSRRVAAYDIAKLIRQYTTNNLIEFRLRIVRRRANG